MGTRIVVLCGAAFCQLVLLAQQSDDRLFRPRIPKTWDEKEVASMELPLPPPAPTVVHVSSDYYYSIPILTIYKSYSVYPPENEPQGYIDWLKNQRPEIIFDASKLKTKADWVKAGQIVYNASPQFTPLDRPRLSTPLWLRYVIRQKGKVEVGSAFSCAACHTALLSDGRVVDGAQRNYGRSYPVKFPKPLAARRDGMRRFFATPWLDPDPNVNAEVTDEELATWNGTAGVADRVGSSLRSPVQIPSLIGLKDRRYYDHSGLHQHRSIGDLMRYAALAFTAVGMERYRQYGDFIPFGTDDFKKLPAPSTLIRFSDEQLYALALFLYSLELPQNPNQPNALSATGQRVFRREGCSGCHTPPIYTNNKLIPVDNFIVPPEHKQKYDILDMRIGLDPFLTLKTRRGTGYYKVPSLAGVWMRVALEHNGSVTNLEDWLDAKRLNDDYVPNGFRGPEKTRPVRGHEFGLSLSPQDKRALIAFLRTL
jgi:hypothetical protein